jgi:hypothetical protein
VAKGDEEQNVRPSSTLLGLTLGMNDRMPAHFAVTSALN